MGVPTAKHLLPLLLALALMPACQSSSSSGGDDDTDTGTDSDSDTDVDTDSDTDTDTDADTDTDSDTGTGEDTDSDDCYEVDGGLCNEEEAVGGYQFTWRLVDQDDQEVTCEEASAMFMELTIVDCTFEEHVGVWLCTDYEGVFDLEVITPGPSYVAAEIQDDIGSPLGIESFCFELVVEAVDNDFGEITVAVEL